MRVLLAALLLLPLASAGDCQSDETARVMGDVIDANTIQLSLVLDGDGIQPGDLVPLCTDEPPLENETRTIGTVQGGCFQSSSAVFVSTWPICAPIRSGVYIYPEPDVEEPQLDEDCIYGIIHDLIGTP